MTPKRKSPFESPSASLISWRQIVRFVRNALIVAAALVLFVDQVGEPLLCWEYRFRKGDPNRTPINATYIGLSGWYESYELGYTDGYPVVFFSRPEPPLWRRCAYQLRLP